MGAASISALRGAINQVTGFHEAYQDFVTETFEAPGVVDAMKNILGDEALGELVMADTSEEIKAACRVAKLKKAVGLAQVDPQIVHKFMYRLREHLRAEVMQQEDDKLKEHGPLTGPHLIRRVIAEPQIADEDTEKERRKKKQQILVRRWQALNELIDEDTLTTFLGVYQYHQDGSGEFKEKLNELAAELWEQYRTSPVYTG